MTYLTKEKMQIKQKLYYLQPGTMQGRIQRLNLTVAFWMKSTCVAEGNALPRRVWGHAPPEIF